MEQWIGERWHRWITRQASTERTDAAVKFEDVKASVGALLRAGGGTQRLAYASPISVGGQRTWLERIAGAGKRAALPQIDAEVLALPATVARYGDRALNRDLYLWWAVLASGMDEQLPWVQANVFATRDALRRFPGMRARWERLCGAELALRPMPDDPQRKATELQLRAKLGHADGALRNGSMGCTRDQVAPVWLWLVPFSQRDHLANAAGPNASADSHSLQSLQAERRRARELTTVQSRNPLLLAPKGESLTIFADPFSIDRGQDDDADRSADVAAQELETLAIQRNERRVAALVHFDLDLPAAASDDIPTGQHELLPEWNWRTQTLESARVSLQSFAHRDEVNAWTPDAALRATAQRVRRRLAGQRSALAWQHGCSDGDEVDFDAWVRLAGACRSGHTGTDAVYQRQTAMRRELVTLLLADLSLSTDAHANDQQRIIEVIRDALYVFAESLHASGDTFAINGFSSLRRSLRWYDLKRFDECWTPTALSRIANIRPGYYTRMGAAVRAATRRLAGRAERQRLLLVLTDGKPHDLDGYEGRYGMADTRRAVHEARAAGLIVFAVSIDQEAGDVMPELFGSAGWAWVPRPEALAERLAALYAQLTRQR
ncbi:MAG: VWA domain-containing protein [Burkholderiales bacterium]|nr:VWA domain-containing protein [Burkholderiales bacterium]